MRKLPVSVLALVSVLLVTCAPNAIAQPKSGQSGYDRWKGYHCDELAARISAYLKMTPEQRKSASPVTPQEWKIWEACSHSGPVPQPKPGEAGYDRWKGYHCDELWAKFHTHQSLTAEEGEMFDACHHLVAPKVAPLPSAQATLGNGLNESFRNSAVKVPPGTFLPPQPPKQYPNPKVLRLPPPFAAL